MSYINKQVTSGEHVIAIGKISLWTHIKAMLIAIILIPFAKPFFILLAILIMIPTIVDYYCTEYIITNKRLIAKRGLIRRNTMEVRLYKIESTELHQTVLGRLFTFGTIVAIGYGGTKNYIKNISKPLTFRKSLHNVIDNHT